MGCFLITLSQFITTIFLILISMFGLTYYGQSSGSMFLITTLTVNISSVIYILYYELRNHQKARGSWKPYLLPLFFVIWFYIEQYFIQSSNVATSTWIFRDVVAVASLGIWGGTFCYRYNKFPEFAKHLELIMLICTISLILALPSMFVNSIGTSIGGGGDHQIVSYVSAIAFGCSAYRFFVNPNFGYLLFRNKYFKYLSFLLMLIQAFICIVGGGRGGFVTLMIIVLCIALTLKMSMSRIISIVVICCVFVGIISNILGSDDFGHSFTRIFDMFNSTVGSVDEERNRIIQKAMSYIRESPISGYGLYSQYDMCQKSVNVPYWHNFFIELLMQGGIILFIFGTIVYLQVILRTRKIIKSSPNHLLLIPLVSYPYGMLMFSGTYMTIPCFWFVTIYVLGYYKNQKKQL